MSYDISMKLHAQRASADWQEARQQTEFEDRERLEFLKRLDDAEDVNVTDWEAQFIEGFLTAPRGLSHRQRECVDEMRKKYEHRLTGKAETRKSETLKSIPDSVPGQCSYLVRGDAGQVRCGQPATQKNTHGAEFCDACWRKITEYQARLRQMKARRW